MVFSDAQPVQFWPINCDTYNEHENEGVFNKCYCAPWTCDDTVTIQFTDTAEGSPPESPDYSLSIRDSEGTEIQNIPFEKSTLLSLDPLSDAENFDPGDEDWTLGPNPTIVVSDDSKILRMALHTTKPDTDYEFHYKINKSTGLLSNGDIRISMFDTAMVEIDFITIPYSNGSPAIEDDVTFQGGDDAPAYIGIQVFNGLSNATITVEEFDLLTDPGDKVVYNLSFIPSELSPDLCAQNVQFFIVNDDTDSDVYKSDCQDIAVNQPNTLLIEYTNGNNFAGLIYDNGPVFSLRIPALLYHQRFPTEQEVFELSTFMQSANSTIKRQRLLDTDYMPYYMHEKILLALAHQTVEIYNKKWTKQEAYEMEEGNRMSPHKKAKCWLSETNFLQRNVL